MNTTKILNCLVIIGMLISLFLVYEHFSPSASKFCSFGAKLDCGIVNKSPYANADGLFYLLVIDFKLPLPYINISNAHFILDLITSNAFLGFLTLVLLFALNTRYKNKSLLFIRPQVNKKWVRGILVFGVVYGFYLFLVQHYLLKTYCIFCLALDAVLLLSLILVYLPHETKSS